MSVLKKYPNLIIPEKITERKIAIEAVLDYIVLQQEEKTILKYTERRWDMYHVLSSTYHTIWIGAVFGGILRLYYQFSLFNGFLSITSLAEHVALVSIFVLTLLLLLLVGRGRRMLMTEYRPIFEAFVRHSEVSEKNLRKVLPDFFKPEPITDITEGRADSLEL